MLDGLITSTRKLGAAAIAGAALTAAFVRPLVADPFLNGFDLGQRSIELSEIMWGGPFRDGIPSIDHPQFVPAEEADFLQGEDAVIGVELNGVARAYPLRILVWHEVVNDQFQEHPVLVTYCPLCAAAIVFHAEVGARRLTFGVSGLLYRSDLLLYDRQTESLWSQLLLRAVTGPMLATSLAIVPSQVLPWSVWRKKFPHTQVLSRETGFARDYSFNPYADYERARGIVAGVPVTRRDFPHKTIIVGVQVGTQAKAYALDQLAPFGSITDVIGNQSIKVAYDAERREAKVIDPANGRMMPFIQAYWFAWQAFYPETDVWAPAVLSIEPSFLIRLSGEKRRHYAVERSIDLRRWETLQVLAPTNGVASFEDPYPLRAGGFYRARRLEREVTPFP